MCRLPSPLTLLVFTILSATAFRSLRRLPSSSLRPLSPKSIMHMSSDVSLAEEAVAKFLGTEEKFSFRPTSGGVNNVVQYVDSLLGEPKYVLRIYNNGFNSERTFFEHAILDQLREMKLSFMIPTTVKSIDTKAAHVLLSNGAEASLFNLIPGTLPKLTRVKEIGRASGELCTAMGNLKISIPSPNPPYYEIYAVHHAVTREKFFAEILTPAFDSCRESIDFMVAELCEIEKSISAFHAMNLPTQLIHGDLHYDNVLTTEDGVSGLLDFEFCALDWRAMELAICLSKYAGEKLAMIYFEDFVSGFVEKGRLTRTEIEAIPQLIILRILSNVVYFVGRALAGEDSIESLTSRADSYARRIKWIRSNEAAIVNMISTKMVEQGVDIDAPAVLSSTSV